MERIELSAKRLKISCSTPELHISEKPEPLSFNTLKSARLELTSIAPKATVLPIETMT